MPSYQQNPANAVPSCRVVLLCRARPSKPATSRAGHISSAALPTLAPWRYASPVLKPAGRSLPTDPAFTNTILPKADNMGWFKSGVTTAIAILSARVANSRRCGDGSVAPLIWQPSMNTFRRFEGASEPMYDFYTEVLGFEPLDPYDVGDDTEVWRIQAGASQLKLSRRNESRSYVDGGVLDATGLRLWTFFYSDEEAVSKRFADAGLPAPVFEDLCAYPAMSCERSALVNDPSGQEVELVITGDADVTEYEEIEVGVVVSDLPASLSFYRDFVGLEEVGTVDDARFGTTKHIFRNNATFVSLRSFGDGLPADTGTGGIQYVVSDVTVVEGLARRRHVTIDQGLGTIEGFTVRTVWLEDPDGITNYFADTDESRGDVET